MSTLMADFGIDRLSPKAKADLAQEIRDSLGQERPAAKLDDERIAEPARRDAESEADPGIARRGNRFGHRWRGVYYRLLTNRIQTLAVFDAQTSTLVVLENRVDWKLAYL